MRAFVHGVCWGGALTVWLTGCTYHVTLRPEVYQSAESRVEAPFPLTVALVASEAFRAQQFKPENVGVTVDLVIDVQPALLNGLRTELAQRFARVLVVSAVEEAPQAAVVAIPTFEMVVPPGEREASCWLGDGTRGCFLLLDLNLLTPQSRAKLAHISHREPYHGTPPMALKRAVGFFLMLTLVGYPLAESLIAADMVARLEEETLPRSLPPLLAGLGEQIAGNAQLVALVEARSGRPVVARPPPAPQPSPPAVAPAPGSPAPALGRLPSVDFGRYHALVIGNNRYRHVPPLETAVADATAVAQVLREQYGFTVTLLTDATADQIRDALYQLRATLTEQDNALLYYAGHGVLDEAAERGYWLPVDAEGDKPTHWVSTVEVTDTLKAMTAKHVLVVADSCYAGTLARGVRVSPLKAGEDPGAYVTRLAAKRSRTALLAGGLEPVLDRSGRTGHSVFAQAFLTALQENAGVLEGEGLFLALRRAVVVNAPQTPEYVDIRFAGHEGGDFLFVRR